MPYIRTGAEGWTVPAKLMLPALCLHWGLCCGSSWQIETVLIRNQKDVALSYRIWWAMFKLNRSIFPRSLEVFEAALIMVYIMCELPEFRVCLVQLWPVEKLLLFSMKHVFSFLSSFDWNNYKTSLLFTHLKKVASWKSKAEDKLLRKLYYKKTATY